MTQYYIKGSFKEVFLFYYEVLFDVIVYGINRLIKYIGRSRGE